jgi:2-polyprenyl-3-methyl-5-hydroxy-6-metoxy-1,4-benzoquinol methylase
VLSQHGRSLKLPDNMCPSAGRSYRTPVAADPAERREVVPFVPRGTQRLLDVGCNEGAFGAVLAEQGVHVHGIEPNASAAELAANRLSAVTIGCYPDDAPNETFDCIVFNDVLEHMTHPSSALEAAKKLHLAPGGTVVASVPNVRNVHVLTPLILRGRWDYANWGIHNRTHLRFFTKTTMRDLFESSGFQVERQEPLKRAGSWPPLRLLGSLGEEFRTIQYAVVARP